MSWQLFVGEIPNEMIICHKCDNRLCVNPKHLFLGTHKDNAIDCSIKKRNISQIKPEKNPKGERHGNSKYSNDVILNIINDYKTLSINELCEKYNETKNYIKSIINGKTWNSVTKISKYKTKYHKKTIEQWIDVAENLAKLHGKLPKNLPQKGFSGLNRCIKNNPNKFSHILR